VLGTGGQDVVHADIAADIAGVDQMLVGQQADAGEVGVARGDGLNVAGGGRGGGHVHDQMGPVGLAGLGEVGLVATPAHPALDPVLDPVAGLGS
jgi:hypothetical protein